MNAKEELIEHLLLHKIGDGVSVDYIKVNIYKPMGIEIICKGGLDDVIKKLDVDYDDYNDGHALQGNIWYNDGSWSERGAYDINNNEETGFWHYRSCPSMND